MDIKESLLTLKDEQGNLKITPRIYYDRFLSKGHKFQYNKLVLCPFHDDTDASLGTFKHKTLRGVELFHCFGCGATGDVIKMHQLAEKKKGNYLSSTDAINELIKLFDVTIDTTIDTSYNAYLKQLSERLDTAMRGYYNIRDFEQDLLSIKNSELDPYAKLLGYRELTESWKRKMKVGASND